MVSNVKPRSRTSDFVLSEKQMKACKATKNEPYPAQGRAGAVRRAT